MCGQAVGQVRPLRAQAALDVGSGHAPAGQSRSLDVAGAIDEPDLVAALGQSTLDKLDGLDHHEGVTVTPSALEALLDEGTDAGVDDGFEVSERRRGR